MQSFISALTQLHVLNHAARHLLTRKELSNRRWRLLCGDRGNFAGVSGDAACVRTVSSVQYGSHVLKTAASRAHCNGTDAAGPGAE